MFRAHNRKYYTINRTMTTLHNNSITISQECPHKLNNLSHKFKFIVSQLVSATFMSYWRNSVKYNDHSNAKPMARRLPREHHGSQQPK